MAAPRTGAWIEILTGMHLNFIPMMPRPARGAWIEIKPSMKPIRYASGRAPHGARGLKLRYRIWPPYRCAVTPSTIKE